MKFCHSLEGPGKVASPMFPTTGPLWKHTPRRWAEGGVGWGGVGLLCLSFAVFAKQVLMCGANVCACITTRCTAQQKSITLQMYCTNCDIGDRTHYD